MIQGKKEKSYLHGTVNFPHRHKKPAPSQTPQQRILTKQRHPSSNMAVNFSVSQKAPIILINLSGNFLCKRRGTHTVGLKLKVVEFTRARCADGKPVANTGAVKGIGVDRRRIVCWVQGREMQGVIERAPNSSCLQITLHSTLEQRLRRPTSSGSSWSV